MNKKLLLLVLVFIILVAALFIFKGHKKVVVVNKTNYTTTCTVIASDAIQCDCDIVLDNDAQHRKFSNRIIANSCDNNLCNDLCDIYINDLRRK